VLLRGKVIILIAMSVVNILKYNAIVVHLHVLSCVILCVLVTRTACLRKLDNDVEQVASRCLSNGMTHKTRLLWRVR
jgi:hypothetical protein